MVTKISTVYLIFCKLGLLRTSFNSWTLGKVNKTSFKTKLSFNQQDLCELYIDSDSSRSPVCMKEKQGVSPWVQFYQMTWLQVDFHHTLGKHPHSFSGLMKADFQRSQSQNGVLWVKWWGGVTPSNWIDFHGALAAVVTGISGKHFWLFSCVRFWQWHFSVVSSITLFTLCNFSQRPELWSD